MAVLWIEGFDSFGTTNGVAPIGTVAKYGDSVMALSTLEAPRLGSGKSLIMDPTGFLRTRSLGTNVTMFIGFAFYYDAVSSTEEFLTLYETGVTRSINFRLTAGGEIACYRDTTLLGTSTTAGLSPNIWYFLEFKAVCSNSAGTIDVRVGGTTNVLSLTSQDTQESGTPGYEYVKLLGSSTASDDFQFDDWYVANDSGSQNNTWLGNVRVDVIMPNAAGDSSDWTPSAGSNYQNVDEIPNDQNTTYNTDSTSTNKDLFNYQSMPTSLGDIKAVQINTVCRQTDATAFTLATLAKTGTTESSDTAQSIGTTSYKVLWRVVELDPDTGVAWTESGINAAQFGYETG